MFFDLLCEGDRDLRGEPFKSGAASWNAALIGSAAHPSDARDRDSSVAADWFRRFEGAGLDGVMAKPVSGTYEPDKRVMLKVKHERDCDCVVAGFRWHKNGERHGGRLAAARPVRRRRRAAARRRLRELHRRRSDEELVEFLAPYRQDALANHPWKHGPSMPQTRRADQRMPGGQSRWSQGKDLSWEPLRPELVVEVAYEHMQGSRFRHMAQFRRWRTDKKPSDCTYAQLEVVPPQELAAIFAVERAGFDATVTFVVLALVFLRSARRSTARRAIRAWDRRPDRAFPAAAAALPARGAGSRECASMWRTCRASSRPAHRPRRAVRPLRHVLLFHRSRPARAASLSGEFATTISGIFVRGFFAVASSAELAREGATRGASPSILRKCGGQGASPRPAASSFAASSSSFSSEPARRPCPRADRRSPRSASGTVSTVKSAGSQSGTSCQ